MKDVQNIRWIEDLQIVERLANCKVSDWQWRIGS